MNSYFDYIKNPSLINQTQKNEIIRLLENIEKDYEKSFPNKEIYFGAEKFKKLLGKHGGSKKRSARRKSKRKSKLSMRGGGEIINQVIEWSGPLILGYFLYSILNAVTNIFVNGPDDNDGNIRMNPNDSDYNLNSRTGSRN